MMVGRNDRIERIAMNEEVAKGEGSRTERGRKPAFGERRPIQCI